MTPRTLQAVLRSLSDNEPSVGDGELLSRYATVRDGQAFAELVSRHGRLVWSICRHLTKCDADADDAFQATFLVLIRNAAKIRNAGKLPAWLHGTAYRICSRARRATQRKFSRESASAKHERNGSVVPDSAWDRAFATVHEEVARLPESLRVPFVLSCLEGLGTTEAARQLGWKLGTYSGRLTRAKDLLAARLELRGVTLGLAAAATFTSLTRVPAAVESRAATLLKDDAAIPKSILQLTQGVLAMKLSTIKMLAALLLIGCGLGLGGANWAGKAEAQPPTDNRAGPFREDPQPGSTDLLQEIASTLQPPRKEGAVASTLKWDYDFVLVSDMTPMKFVKFLQDRETRGWEFNGQTTLLHEGKPAGHWVFRRESATWLRAGRVRGTFTPVELKLSNDSVRKGADIPAKGRSQKELAALFDVLESGAERKFGADKLKITFDVRGAGSIHVEGTPEAVEWAIDVIGKLQAK